MQLRLDGRLPRRHPEWLSTHDRASPLFATYVDTYDAIADDDLRDSIQSREHLRIKTETVVGLLGPLPPGTRVLDVGVGQGHLLEALRTLPGLELTGVDVAAPYLRRLAAEDERTQVLVTNAENLPFRDAFDAIVSTDVIEHVLNVGDYLLSLRRALAPGGRVLIRAPHREDLLQYARLGGCPYEMVHLRTFDRRLLVEQLRAAGLVPESVTFDGWFPGRTRPLLGHGRLASRAAGLAERTVIGPRYGLSRAAAIAARTLVVPIEITVVARLGEIPSR